MEESHCYDEDDINEGEFDEARQAAIESSQRAAGIKEGYIGDENYEDQKGTADQKLWVLTKLIDAGIFKNPSSEYAKALKAVEHPDADEAAKSMRENINEGDLFSSEFDRAELKDIINDLNKGLILDMPTRRAYKFLVSLLDKEDKEELGLSENGHVEEYTDEIAEADIDVDLVRATAAKANNQITNAAGMADFILDVINQIGEKEQEGILNNINLKQAINFLEKAKESAGVKKVDESHAMGGVEAELEAQKAALNAASMSLSHDCRERGIAVGIIHLDSVS